MHKEKDDQACSYLRNNNYILTLISYPNFRAYYMAHISYIILHVVQHTTKPYPSKNE